MQLQQVEALTKRLKENSDASVETTTLGRFLGSKGERLAVTLGKTVLSRPVIVSTFHDSMQVIDLSSGFIVTLQNGEDVLAKLLDTYSRQPMERPKVVASVERNEDRFKMLLEKSVPMTGICAHICEINDLMHASAPTQKKMELVTKTINLLEEHKCECQADDLAHVEKTQGKLRKLITYSETKKLAPGQIPSVFEIAVWKWVN